jgi:hypothetical protein
MTTMLVQGTPTRILDAQAGATARDLPAQILGTASDDIVDRFNGADLLAQAQDALSALPPEQKKIVIIGDSHSDPDQYPPLSSNVVFGRFGAYLMDVTTALGASPRLYGVSGSSIDKWLAGNQPMKFGHTFPPGSSPTWPSLPQIVKSESPGMMIIEQGANMLGWPKSRIDDAVERVRSTVPKNVKLLWVGAPAGPPDTMAARTAVNDLLKAACEDNGIAFCDSGPMQFQSWKGTDEHLAMAPAAQWAVWVELNLAALVTGSDPPQVV